jgi:integrase
VIRDILDAIDSMRPRYQDPKIRKRTDVPRPYWYIRAFVPVYTARHGLTRERKSMRLGFCDETTLTAAKAEKQRVLAGVNSGATLIRAQVPLSEICAKFTTAYAPALGAATREKYANAIERHILPDLGGCRLCDLDAPTVQGWLNAKERAGLGWHYRKDLRATLSSLIERAREWRVFEGENPAAGVKIRGEAKRQRRIPTAEQLQAFLTAIHDTAILPATHARLVVMAAVVGGLRVSEVLGLRVEDLDRNAQSVRVDERWRRGDIGQPKSATSRRTRQVGELARDLSIVAMGKQPGEYLFARNGRPPDDRDLQQHVFRPAAERAGIYYPGFGMHSFRRLNITWRQEAGATPYEAQQAAGHASPDMTFLYTIADVSREKEHVAAILARTKGRVQ